MTTPSGTITMANVNTELGRSTTASVNMNETAVRALARVASGAISMDNLRNKKFIDFAGFTLVSTGAPFFGETADATLWIDSNGDWYGIDNAGFGGSTVYSGSWIPTTNAGVIDDYDVRVTQTSGGFVGGTLATWLNMGSGPHLWSVTEFYDGSNAASLTVEFRNAATGTIVETGYVQLQASF
jgi:hypothetical protein